MLIVTSMKADRCGGRFCFVSTEFRNTNLSRSLDECLHFPVFSFVGRSLAKGDLSFQESNQIFSRLNERNLYIVNLKRETRLRRE
jgi:hypothetical protein